MITFAQLFEPTSVDILLENMEEACHIKGANPDSDKNFEKFGNYSLLKIQDVL